MMDDFAELAQHLSEEARTSLFYADSIARGYGSQYIGTEHLLLGILSQGSNIGAKVLADAGVTLDAAEVAFGLKPVTQSVRIGVNTLSESSKVTLRLGWETAKSYHQDQLGTEHILHSMLSQRHTRASRVLSDKLNISIQDVLAELEGFFERRERVEGDQAAAAINSKGPGSALAAYGTDITELATKKKLDPLVGRSREVERMAVILGRRTKNNPVLIGEPGVGKTAIVEGLAQRIVAGQVPDTLSDKRIIQLDIAAMISGTKYRGEFEERLTRIVDELTKRKDIIVFIDELHLLMGAGAAEGALDAANMLKPALARGDIKLIGATTIDEYKKHIEKDSAFDRRLQTILVEEPSTREVVRMLQGLKGSYEKHHRVSMTDEVVEQVVTMADRYITQRFMPDKAIDVLDESAALVRVTRGQESREIGELKAEIAELEEKIAEAVSEEKYDKAALYKTRSAQLKIKLEDIEEKDGQSKAISLTDDDVARAVSIMAGIPVGNIHRDEAKMLLNLEKKLGKRVIGQKEAIESVAKSIRRSRSGFGSRKRPIGSYIFMGPTGVGKTELARVLSEEVFGSPDSLIKIDMSEFAERHNVSRLVGAPAGYVGYDEGGQLTDKVRRQPYSVILFDEIEKAHPEVMNMLLQILEDGSLTDASGRKVSFAHTVVILTSNLGSSKMQKTASLGFEAATKSEKKVVEEEHKTNAAAAKKELEKFMRPELINRFDDIVVFHPLTRQEVGRVFELFVRDLKERLITQGLGVEITPAAKRHLVDKGYDTKYGLRPLRRVIEQELENKIADGILKGDFEKGDIIKVGTQRGQIEIQTQAE